MDYWATIEARIKELETERERLARELQQQLFQQLNLQLAPHNAAIGELKKLVEMKPKPTETQPEAQPEVQ